MFLEKLLNILKFDHRTKKVQVYRSRSFIIYFFNRFFSKSFVSGFKKINNGLK